MPITNSVGNCAVNQHDDVIVIKNLVFQIRPDLAGGLKDAERAKVSQTGVCEPELIQCLARAQKASDKDGGSQAARNEALSGGRVMPGSGTLTLLERNAGASAGIAEIRRMTKSLMASARTIADALPAPRRGSTASALTGLAGSGSVSGGSVSGRVDASASSIDTGGRSPVVNLGALLRRIALRQATSIKLGSNWSGSLGIGPAAGTFGQMTFTQGSDSRTFDMGCFGASKSISPVSVSYSTPDNTTIPIGGCVFRGFDRSTLTLDDLEGDFLVFGVAGAAPDVIPGAPNGAGLNIYCLGFESEGMRILGGDLAASNLARAYLITFGFMQGTPDAGISAQTGTLKKSQPVSAGSLSKAASWHIGDLFAR